MHRTASQVLLNGDRISYNALKIEKTPGFFPLFRSMIDNPADTRLCYSNNRIIVLSTRNVSTWPLINYYLTRLKAGEKIERTSYARYLFSSRLE